MVEGTHHVETDAQGEAQPLSGRLALLWSQFAAKGRQLVRPKRHLAVLAVLVADRVGRDRGLSRAAQ